MPITSYAMVYKMKERWIDDSTDVTWSKCVKERGKAGGMEKGKKEGRKTSTKKGELKGGKK